jgi:DNA adenine methylase
MKSIPINTNIKTKPYEGLECGGAKTTPRPFVKWVGGKIQLLPELIARISTNFSRYIEPFIGGGTLFFYLQHKQLEACRETTESHPPKPAVVIDINEELINTYQVIRDNPEELIADLKKHIYDPEYYYQIRNIDRVDDYRSWSKIQKASRLIYLNKTCFNGLYRVNSKGHFNSPIGKYKNPKIVDEINLRTCSQFLQNTKIICGSFLEVEKLVEENAISPSQGDISERLSPESNSGRAADVDAARPLKAPCVYKPRAISKDDFVYFDPPYAPLNATSNFTEYSQNGFDESMQLSLRDLCLRLDRLSVRFMVSNSNAPLILDLYRDFNIELIYANRAINSKADKRGKIPEVVITNTSF